MCVVKFECEDRGEMVSDFIEYEEISRNKHVDLNAYKMRFAMAEKKEFNKKKTNQTDVTYIMRKY